MKIFTVICVLVFILFVRAEDLSNTINCLKNYMDSLRDKMVYNH